MHGVNCPSGWLVATDLDHTLMCDPASAGLAGAAIRAVEAEGVRVIPASSKTFAEMLGFLADAELSLRPFLFENGCGIGWPEHYAAPPAGMAPVARQDGCVTFLLIAPADAARAAVRRLLGQHGPASELLEDMAPADLAALTGLDLASAALAGRRLASVPILWRDGAGALAAFRTELARFGLEAVSGGRFVHVSSPWDKARGLGRLRGWLGGAAQSARLLACGDSENDRALLEAADLALVFPSPGGGWMALDRPARRVSEPGPEAWQQAVLGSIGDHTRPTAALA
jgi:mannosyl-3-phosphoglycerate phosphatase family protein